MLAQCYDALRTSLFSLAGQLLPEENSRSTKEEIRQSDFTACPTAFMGSFVVPDSFQKSPSPGVLR